MEERAQRAREEEERTMRRELEEEGRKIDGGAGWRWQWGTSCSASVGVGVGEGDTFVASSYGKKMEERERWASEKEERTMRREVEEEGCKIEGEGGVGRRWGTLCSASSGVAVGEGDMFVASSHRKKMEEQERWAREEDERTMRREVEEEGRNIEREGGAGWRWGTSCSVSSGVAVGEKGCCLQATTVRRWRSGHKGQGRRRNGR
jgi:hypothetical protein